MEGLFCVIMFVVVFIAVGIIVVRLMHAAEHDRRMAKDLYQRKLAALKREPTNATLYEETLAAGREHVRLSRKVSGLPTFDEVLLNQDLNAARASVGQVMVSSEPSPVVTSVQDRLRELYKLKQDGLISEEEYDSKRQKLLDEL